MKHECKLFIALDSELIAELNEVNTLCISNKTTAMPSEIENHLNKKRFKLFIMNNYSMEIANLLYNILIPGIVEIFVDETKRKREKKYTGI